jgi:hypothetical protein
MHVNLEINLASYSLEPDNRRVDALSRKRSFLGMIGGDFELKTAALAPDSSRAFYDSFLKDEERSWASAHDRGVLRLTSKTFRWEGEPPKRARISSAEYRVISCGDGEVSLEVPEKTGATLADEIAKAKKTKVRFLRDQLRMVYVEADGDVSVKVDGHVHSLTPLGTSEDKASFLLLTAPVESLEVRHGGGLLPRKVTAALWSR